MVNPEGPHLGLPFRNGDMARTVVSHQDDILIEIHGIILGERSTHTKAVEYFHGLNVLDLVFARHRNAPCGQHGIAKDDGTDGILVIHIAGPHVVISHGTQIMLLDQTIQRHRSASSAFQLGLWAIRLNVENTIKIRNTCLNLIPCHIPTQGCQFVHLHNFHVATKMGAVLGEIRRDVQHAAVVMPHEPQPVVEHDPRHAGCFNPIIHLIPTGGVVVKHARDLMKIDPGPIKHTGYLRNGAGCTMCQPLPGHRCSISQPVEMLVIDGWNGLQIQHNDGHARPLDHWQHRRRQRVGCDMEKDQIHILATKSMSSLHGLRGAIDQTQVHHVHSWTLQTLAHYLKITFQTLLEPLELRPIGVQTNAKKTNSNIHGYRVLLVPILWNHSTP